MITTDNQNELFDVVDENDNVIGRAKRGEVHRNKNLIHRSIGVVIFNRKGEIYLQRRSATKDTDPLKWTISCSGHVESGDTYEVTVKRELMEELGILIPFEYVTKFICRAPSETEMSVLYKGVSEGPFKLLKEEISGGRFFGKEELKKEVETGKILLSFMGKAALEKIGFIALAK